MSYKNYFLILHSGQNHLPLGFLLIFRHSKWNHLPLLQWSFSHSIIFFFHHWVDRPFHMQYISLLTMLFVQLLLLHGISLESGVFDMSPLSFIIAVAAVWVNQWAVTSGKTPFNRKLFTAGNSAEKNSLSFHFFNMHFFWASNHKITNIQVTNV